jgi:hypothetical protein
MDDSKICETCGGIGETLENEVCPECKGHGHIDWVSKAMASIKRKKESLIVGATTNSLIGSTTPSHNIVFHPNGSDEAIKICENGDFFVKGKKVTNDKKLYKAFVDFFSGMGLYK